MAGFPGGSGGHESACRRLGVDPWVRKIPRRREWWPTPVFLPEESHKQRSLTGYSPLGCKQSDTTEQLRTHTHSHTLTIRWYLTLRGQGWLQWWMIYQLSLKYQGWSVFAKFHLIQLNKAVHIQLFLLWLFSHSVVSDSLQLLAYYISSFANYSLLPLFVQTASSEWFLYFL